MNQPPNTTKEQSKCCGAKKKLILTTAEYNGDDENNGFWDACSNCGKPFIPSPSVCEVAKGAKVAHRRFCGKSGFNCAVYHLDGICPDVRDCEGCKAELSIPTEPKKTVEKCDCSQVERQVCDICQKVTTATAIDTPIQTGNDESWEVQWDKMTDTSKIPDGISEASLWLKEHTEEHLYDNYVYGEPMFDLSEKKIKDFIQKAVLQERAKTLYLIADDMGWEDSRDHYAKLLGVPLKYFK